MRNLLKNGLFTIEALILFCSLTVCWILVLCIGLVIVLEDWWWKLFLK